MNRRRTTQPSLLVDELDAHAIVTPVMVNPDTPEVFGAPLGVILPFPDGESLQTFGCTIREIHAVQHRFDYLPLKVNQDHLLKVCAT